MQKSDEIQLLQPGTMIEGHTVIGEKCIIGPNSQIVDSEIGDGTTVHSSVVLASKIGRKQQSGRSRIFVRNLILATACRIGNFVEVKKSTLGEGSKVSHLSYIGDAKLVRRVNVGCGTIIVNYDGKNKHITTIEDDAFIGCNSNLIAPVTVGKGAYVAAGSTISKNVPESSLAIARARQENKEGYVKKLKLK